MSISSPKRKTGNLGLQLLQRYQLDKEQTINENLTLLDHYIGSGIESRTKDYPPANPLEGKKYIVGKLGKKEWQDREGQIATFSPVLGAWRFTQPSEGMVFWVLDESLLIVYQKDEWRKIAVLSS